jgi:GNAT superfamily N-acetyltransferase
MIVRPARQDDVPAIVSFSAAMALETEGRRLDQARLLDGTRALLATPERGFFMVAEDERGQLIGQLMITFEWSDWRNAVFWWIQSVYVAPAWRRQGVYRRMHETIVAQAKADPSVCGIRLYVERQNGTARTVYQRVGLAPSAYAVYEQDFVLARRGLPPEKRQEEEAR